MKRIISIVLTLALCLSLCPTVVFAEEVPVETAVARAEKADGETISADMLNGTVPSGTVTPCDHSAATGADNGNGTHTITECPVCGWEGSDTRPHTYNAEGNCTVCGAQAVATVTVNGTTTYYVDIESAWAAAKEGSSETAPATLSLLTDVTASKGLSVSRGNSIIFDGGEYTLNTTSSRSTIRVNEGGTLAITDGTITSNYQVIEMWGGTVTISGGTVTGNTGIEINTGGNVTIVGGTVTGQCGIYMYNGEVAISGGEITGDTWGIRLMGDTAAVTVSGGTVTGSGVASDGIAVYGLEVRRGMACLMGGTFSGTSMAISADSLAMADLLAEGYAFKQNGNWIMDTSGNALYGTVTVQKIPLTLNPDPQSAEAWYFGAPHTLAMNATPVDDTVGAVTYVWKNGETALDSTADTCEIPADMPVGSYTYTCEATCDGYPLSHTFAFEIKQSGTQFTGGVKAYNGAEETTDFTVDDTITVKAAPAATGTAPVSAAMSVASFTPPATEQMALFVGDAQVSEPVDKGDGGIYTMTVKAADVLALSGKEPNGDPIPLTARFVGNDSMADAEDTVEVTVSAAVKVEKGGQIIGYVGESGLDAAFNNSVYAGATITLLADVTRTATLTIKVNCILDLGGHTITFTDSENVCVQGGSTVTIQGEGEIISEQIHALVVVGSVTLEGGTFTSNKGDCAGVYVNYGTLSVIGENVVIQNTSNGGYGLAVNKAQSVQLSAGTYKGEKAVAVVGGSFTLGDLLNQEGASRVAYYKDNATLVTEGLDGKELPAGTYTIKACTHDYRYAHTPGATTHNQFCPACGDTMASENCSYDTGGKCVCGATLAVTLPDDLALTYTGAAQEPAVSVTLDDQVLDAANYAVSYANNINAGMASVTVTGTNGITFDKTLTFQITPADISSDNYCSFCNPTETNYNGTEQRPEIQLIRLDNSVVLDPDTDYDLAILRGGAPTDDFTSAGIVELVFTGKGNYTGTFRGEYYIRTVPVEVSGAGTASGVYGTKLSELNVTGLTVQSQYDDSPTVFPGVWKIDGDEDEILAAGTHTRTATFTPTADAQNFQNIPTAEITVTISKADLTLTGATVSPRAYLPGNVAADVSGVTFAGLVNGETLTLGTDYTATGIFETADAGTGKNVTVTVTLKDSTKANNYTLASNTGATTGDIDKAHYEPIIITGLPDGVITYGDTFTLSAGSAISWSATGAAVDGWGNVTVTSAGEVTVTATKSGNDNYYPAEATITFTAVRKSLTPVVEGDTAKTYDGTTDAPDGLTIRLTGVVDGDNVTAAASSYTYDSADAGTRTINASGITLSGTAQANYALSAASAVAAGRIEKAPLTLTGATVSPSVYQPGNIAADVSGVTFAGLVNSETLTLGTDYTATGIFETADAGTVKNVTVTVTLKDTDKANNYNLASNTVATTGNIAQADSVITTIPTAGGITYGQSLSDSALSGGAANTPGTFAWDDGSLRPAAGTAQYTVTLTPDDPNYNTATTTVSVAVAKAVPTIAWNSTTLTLTYTGNAAAIVAPTVTLVNGETYGGDITYSYTSDGETTPVDGLPINAGSYQVTASIAAQDNYTAAETAPALALTINKADQPAPNPPTATDENIRDTSVTLTAVENAAYSMDDETWQDSPVFTGLDPYTEYNFYIRLKEDANHNASPSSRAAITTRKTLLDDAVVTVSGSYTYTGAAIVPAAAEVTVRLGAQTIDPGKYTISAANNIHAGTATVTITAAADSAYSGSANGTFAIARAALTITANDQTITYGERIALGTAQVTPTGLCSGDVLHGITLTASTENVPGGVIAPSAAQIQNARDEDTTADYTITYRAGTLTIHKSQPALAFKDSYNPSKTYDSLPVASPTADALVITGADYDDVVFTWYNDDAPLANGTAPTNTGIYTLTASIAATANTEAASADLSVTIRPKTVGNPTIELSPNVFEYDGTEKKPTVIVQDGDTVIPSAEYTLTYSNNINAGTATVTITDKTGGNYTVNGSATFAITQKPLANAAVSVSGHFIYDGQAKSPAITVSLDGAVVPPSEYDISYSNTNGGSGNLVHAGAVTVTVTAKTDGNYAGACSATFTIGKKTLIPAIEGNTTKIYDGTTDAPNGLTIMLYGVVDGDDVTATASSYTYDSAGAGTRTITASGLILSGAAQENYELSAASATTTGRIEKAAVSITWDSTTQTVAYTGGPAAITSPTVSAENGVTISTIPSYSYATQGSGDFIEGLPTNAGTYTVRSTIAESDNLTAAEADMTLTIEKAPLALTGATVTPRAYQPGNVAADVSGVTFAGLVNGETLTLGTDYTATGIFETADAGTGKNVTVTVTLKDTDKANNYNLASNTVATTGDIAQADSVITTIPTAGGITYGQSLSDSALSDGAANTPGTFAWDDGSLRPAAGTAQYTVTFTPDDPNYSTATANVSVSVAKAAPTLTAPTASVIHYGQRLSDSTLAGGTAVNPYSNAAVDGSWNWVNTDTQPIETGAHPVVFIPGDTTNYLVPESIHTTVTISAAEPAITLTAPDRQMVGKTVTVTCTVENPHDAAFTDGIPSAVLTYRIGNGAQQPITDGALTIPEETAAGTAIVITAATAAVDGKYTTATQTATVTVLGKTMVTISGVSAEDAVYNGQPHKGYTGAPTATPYSGDFTFTYTGRNDTGYHSTDAPTNAGDYTLAITLMDADEYTGSKTLDFTINQASITITADDKQADIGAEKPALTYVVTGLVGGDALATEPLLTCDADMGTAGQYPITVSGATVPDGGNYNAEITYVAGMLTVIDPAVHVTGVSLNKTSITLTVGDSEQLTATIVPSNATNKTVTWASSNTAVATVDKRGNVTATGTGSATITVTAVDGGKTAACTVSVRPGGNDVPSTPDAAPDAATSTVPVSFRQNTIYVDVSVSGSTATLSKTDRAQINNLVGDGLKTAMVEIDFTGLGKTIDAVKLPAATIKQISAKAQDEEIGGLTVKVSNGEITFDASALLAIHTQAGSQITLTLTPASHASLNAQQKKAVGSAPVYSLTLQSDGNAITDLQGGYATVSLSYALKQGQRPSGIIVYYLDRNGNATPCTTTYNDRRKFATFTTGHLSLYFVLYDPATVWVNPYADVTENAWYYNAVQFVTENGLMSGYGNDQFGANDYLTRAQLAQILHNLEGKPIVNYLMRFADVPGSAWYAEAVRWAAAEGVVNGYGNGMFGPNDKITREQLAVMLWRYAGCPAATDQELRFIDATEVSDYALKALRWAVERRIIDGYASGRLDLQGQATRAQVAQMLMNFLKKG